MVTIESAPVLYRVAFNPYYPEFSPPVPTNGGDGTAPPAGAGTALAAHVLTKTPTPKISIPMAIGSGKKIQTAHNQRRFLPLQTELPPTLTVTSRQYPVMERVTVTKIMSSCMKTCPQDRLICRKLRDIFMNSSRYMRLLQ